MLDCLKHKNNEHLYFNGQIIENVNQFFDMWAIIVVPLIIEVIKYENHIRTLITINVIINREESTTISTKSDAPAVLLYDDILQGMFSNHPQDHKKRYNLKQKQLITNTYPAYTKLYIYDDKERIPENHLKLYELYKREMVKRRIKRDIPQDLRSHDFNLHWG